jgi:hypothetical protein
MYIYYGKVLYNRFWWGRYPPGVQLPPPPFYKQINKTRKAAVIRTHTPSWVAPGYHLLQDSRFIDKGHPRAVVIQISVNFLLAMSLRLQLESLQMEKKY